jgi:membrane associated rhomboid family serine protease
MNNFLAELSNILTLFIQHLPFALTWLAIIWGVQLVNWLLGYRLNYLGIHPRRVEGLPGIVLAPFLHGSFNHLFFNSIPLLIFFDFLSMNGKRPFYWVTGTIVIVSGVLIWLFGRSKTIHVGASSLILGYMGYLLVNTYYHPGLLTFLLAVVAVYYFGVGLLATLLSPKAGTSWEGHLFGLLAGIATPYILQLFFS